MPLSKVRDKERKRLIRLDKTTFQPNTDAPQSISSLVEGESSSRIPLYRRGGDYKTGELLKDPDTGIVFKMPELDEEKNPIW